MVKADLEIRGIDKDNTIMRWEDYYGLYYYGKDKQEFLKKWLCSEKELDINNDQISETSFIPFPVQYENSLSLKNKILKHWNNCIKSEDKG